MSMLAGKRVALVTDRDLSIGGKGNVQRILALIRVLLREGARVTLVTRRSAIPPPFSGALRQIVLDAPAFAGGSPADFDPMPYRAALEALGEPQDIAIAAYCWLAPALAAFPAGTLRAVDLHDIMQVRTEHMRAAGLDPWVTCARDEEARLLAWADVLLAITPADAVVARATLAGPRQIVGTVTYSLVPPPAPPRSTGKRLLFVGSAHAGNHAIGEFLAECLPRLRRADPEIDIDIIGGVCTAPAVAAAAGQPGVRLRGFVDDLAAAYRDATVVVAPIRAGSGLKIKTVEALAHGRALVTLPEGVAGMASDDAPWLLCHDWPCMAQAIRALISAGPRRHALEQRALAYVAEHHGDDCAAAQLRGLLARGAGAVAA